MNSNTNLISDLQDFMFNEENIKSYLKKRDEYYKDKLDKDVMHKVKKDKIN